MPTNSTPENDIPLILGRMGSGKKSSLGIIGLRHFLHAPAIDWAEHQKQQERLDKALRELYERMKGA